SLSLPEDVPVQTGESLKPLTPEQLPAVRSSVTSNDQSASASPVSSRASASSVTAMPEAKPQSPAVKLSEDEQILLSWRASEYTLQLLGVRSEEHTSEIQSRENLVCR